MELVCFLVDSKRPNQLWCPKTYTVARVPVVYPNVAPLCPVEVLDAKCGSYPSDVYSFGVVVWEVLPRKIPWEDECLRNILVRVVIKEQRPEIPPDSPAVLANVIKPCCDCVPSNRPTFNDIMESMG